MEPKRRSRSRIPSWAPLFACVVAGYTIFYLLLSRSLPSPQIGFAEPADSDLHGKIKIHNMNALRPEDPAYRKDEQKVLILSPMSKFYPEYWKNVLDLSYDHQLIDLGFIVPNNEHGDQVLQDLVPAIKKAQSGPDPFREVHVLRQDTDSPASFDEKDRHALANQKERRKQQALARNSLLFTTMQSDTAWVFWLDADIVETPRTIIQDMIKKDKDVLVANCYQRYKENNEDKIRPYDYNSWIDSDKAQEMGNSMDKDDILLEGYAEMATYRSLMAYQYSANGSPDLTIELDGVGGTSLMVRADVHRDGAMFPPFAFYHLIETEGFAKMAKRLNYKVWGLPNYLVYHYNE